MNAEIVHRLEQSLLPSEPDERIKQLVRDELVVAINEAIEEKLSE